MRIGMTVFRVLLGLAWLGLLAVSVNAVRQLGLGAAGDVFFSDMSHPWRAQYNTDFLLHVVLVAAWMVYRSRSWIVGLICGLLAINVGGVFTLAYILVATFQAKGDMRKVLLGWRARETG